AEQARTDARLRRQPVNRQINRRLTTTRSAARLSVWSVLAGGSVAMNIEISAWQMKGQRSVVLSPSRPMPSVLLILLLLIMVAKTYLQKVGGKTTMQEKGYEVTEIRDRLFYLSDGAYNTMFLVSSEGVIVVDPLPTLGVKYLQAIVEVTDKPVTHIVYSHEHTDHIGAASLFPKNAVIIAHRETAELLRRRNDPRRPVPTVTFDKNYTLKVGDQTLELYYRGVNHEAGNIFIYAPRQKAL